jgi:hypothetical protein
VVLPLSGCGGGSAGQSSGPTAQGSASSSPSPSPTSSIATASDADYIHQVCGAFTGFVHQVKSDVAPLKAKVDAAAHKGDLKGIKTAFVGFLGDAVSQIHRAHGVVARAGEPAGADGPRIRHALLNVFSSLSQRFSAAHAKALRIDDTNAPKAEAQIQRIAKFVNVNQDAVVRSLHIPSLENGPLASAANDDAGCRTLARLGNH